MKDMNKVFLLQHSYEVGEFDETKLIGIYSSKEKAESTVERFKHLSGFKDYPHECFYIDEIEIDKDHWTEGFIKWEEALEGFE